MLFANLITGRRTCYERYLNPISASFFRDTVLELAFVDLEAFFCPDSDNDEF